MMLFMPQNIIIVIKEERRELNKLSIDVLDETISKMKRIIHKVRSNFHKPTKAHIDKTKYNRKKDKQRTARWRPGPRQHPTDFCRGGAMPALIPE